MLYILLLEPLISFYMNSRLFTLQKYTFLLKLRQKIFFSRIIYAIFVYSKPYL